MVPDAKRFSQALHKEEVHHHDVIDWTCAVSRGGRAGHCIDTDPRIANI